MENVKEKIPVQDGLFNWPNPPQGLIVSKCSVCEELVFPTQDFCPECCTETMEPIIIHSTGKLRSYTEITAPPPGYKGTVPYTIGIVEFPEGIKIIGLTTERTIDRLVPGMEVNVIIDTAFVEDGKEYLTYKFKPAE
ncbi:OB-fold domain-containing protein [Bacillus sp. AGMB 02131]|uniref:OB-fold domain-containing protein n=1 Tax=Peribacillus faecalis TaxID=2772559 RepID=A0A927CTR8_9BACI|nr:OB-fold domain-containing protein [Peribacillus faecalis]MBD3107296.1 OB-fold domain-containing protein [Peribacillus faecalis]